MWHQFHHRPLPAYREIASEFGESVSAVKMRIHRLSQLDLIKIKSRRVMNPDTVNYVTCQAMAPA